MGEEKFDGVGAFFPEPFRPNAVKEESEGRDRRPGPPGASSDSEARYEARPNGSPTPISLPPQDASLAIDGPQPDQEAAAPGVGGVPSPGHDQATGDRQGDRRAAHAGQSHPSLMAEDYEGNSIPPPFTISIEPLPPPSDWAFKRAEARTLVVRFLARQAVATRNSMPLRKAA